MKILLISQKQNVQFATLKYQVAQKKAMKNQQKLYPTWYDFTVQKEYLFLKNIYSSDDLAKSESISSLKNFTMLLTIFLK